MGATFRRNRCVPESADRQNFERIILPHLDAAYNLARHMLRAEADAHDVVQESLMRAWRYFASFRGTDPLPWLLQIVRHAAFSMLERRRSVPLPEDLPLIDESAPDPAASLIEQLDAEFLRQTVDGLPPIYREVIILRELQGLSYKQIAEVTGSTLGTVMSRISRARRQLEAAIATRERGGREGVRP
jgi:RNA polymerase sigma-70 factor, ECF subfamily